jgi:GntR family transcriptional regulator
MRDRERQPVATARQALAGDEAGPLYSLVRRMILADLRDGLWRAGHRLPTEPQLADRFGVSISTVRKAIDALVSENILLRQAGRGTFVACYNTQENFERFFQFADEQGRSLAVDSELLSFEIAEADPGLQAKLRSSQAVAHIANLRRAAGKPVILDRVFVPLEVFPGLTREGFESRTGLIYGFYQERFGITVVRVEESLTACAADADIAAALELAPGTPLLRIERLAFSFDDRPVEWRHRYVNTEHYAYRNVIGLRD